MSEIVSQLLAGRYRLGPKIGAGGMSMVYQALDLRMSRQVAIKIVDRQRSPVLTERLFREAKAAGRANHPALITVFGYGSDDALELDYLVMELLEGEDLAARLARVGRLADQLLLRLACEIADALVHVHQAGVVHRDLKPANIFLASRGRRVDEIKLLDFGVAKHLDQHTLTAPGQVVGTIAYMAPEQITDPARVDPRSDLYALGVVLFEGLTGQRPFRGDTVAELVLQTLHSEVPDPRTLHPGVSPAWSELVLRCLQRKAADRFRDARVLYDALHTISLQTVSD